MPRSLYLHVPFCPKICPYCDFHKMRRSEGLVAAYLGRLKEEAQALYAEFPYALDTVYFGGGTPSHLRDDELGFVVETLRQTWGFPGVQETTLEADPLTFDKARLETFSALGFNRLSIGMQSTQDHVLKFLGRQHNGREGLKAVEMALEAGFTVSADIITAVPEQDAAQDLHALAQTGVPHISVYNLTIEPNTPFARRGVRVDEDREADDYARTDEILSGYGLERYEVSSHAKPGFEAVHNSVYWQGAHFLALGPSAASFVPSPGLLGERRTNPVIKGWLQGAKPDVLAVGPLEYVQDVLMTGLRTRRGVDWAELKRRSGVDVVTHFAPELRGLEGEGLLEREGDFLRTTPTGLTQLNRVVASFF
jgi:putative oxygen-independent coproporphyrinogen III oxidase